MRVVNRVVVVIVGDVGNVRDPRVGHIDVTNVILADKSSAKAVIPRVEGLAPTQGEPSAAAAESKAERYAEAPSESANPTNQRWCIERTPAHAEHRARGPTPRSTPGDPSAIVEGSKAPGCTVNPSPAPRRNPNPMSEAIGRPANR